MHKLKAIRTLLDVTQGELAEALGCSQANVWQMETQGQMLLPDRAERLIGFASKRGIRLTLDQVYGRTTLPAPAKKAA
jgi:transcriptional regulator with XRE-family HTH domain